MVVWDVYRSVSVALGSFSQAAESEWAISLASDKAAVDTHATATNTTVNKLCHRHNPELLPLNPYNFWEL